MSRITSEQLRTKAPAIAKTLWESHTKAGNPPWRVPFGSGIKSLATGQVRLEAPGKLGEVLSGKRQAGGFKLYQDRLPMQNLPQQAFYHVTFQPGASFVSVGHTALPQEKVRVALSEVTRNGQFPQAFERTILANYRREANTMALAEGATLAGGALLVAGTGLALWQNARQASK
jgi:hypothetical protein